MLGRLLRLTLLGTAGAAAARALRARQQQGAAPAPQPLTSEPDRLPNEPVRPAHTTPAPTGRATPDAGADDFSAPTGRATPDAGADDSPAA